MSTKPSILVQLDTDPLPSVFDRVVAVDSGATHIFSYGGIKPDNVMPLVHGCIFTRGAKDLHSTAIFIGGSDVLAGELLLGEVKKHLIPSFGLTVSVMHDSNGANTTAAAAIISARRHLDLAKSRTLILGGTGPVGQRCARLLAKLGGHVRLGSRQLDRAEVIVKQIRHDLPGAAIEACCVGAATDAPAALEDRDLVIAAGAPGVVLLPKKHRENAKSIKVLIDLNGVPPNGIEGLEPFDKATLRDGGISCYGALGVGGMKMKIHKAAIAELFTKNSAILALEEIYNIGVALG